MDCRESRGGRKKYEPRLATADFNFPLNSIPLGFRSLQREQDNFTNRGRIGQEHTKPVDAHSETAGGRHAMS